MDSVGALQRWRERVRRWTPLAGLALALVVGGALRLGFYGVIEWKGDEQWTFVHAKAMAASGANISQWPPVGMASSVGAPNPGLSLWVFTWLMELGARTPPDLARAVQALSVVALLAFAAFGFLAISKQRREPWLWAAALWAANPASIILERKIWTPSVLPLPAVGMLWAWRYRRHRAAAFAWGLLGALMAQIHLGAGLFAAALAIWTLVADRRAFPWIGWIAGGLVGALPAIPWALDLAQHAWPHGPPRPPAASFYLRWPNFLIGNGPQYTLNRAGFADFLNDPRLNGSPTHLAAALQVALLAATALLVVRAAQKLLRDRGMPPRALFLGDSPETLMAAAAFWGYGGLLTLITFAGAGSYRHYMEIIAPLMALWTALFALWTDKGAQRPWARATLVVICAAQAGLSLCLLAYIERVGATTGDFGVSWRAQQAGVRAALSAPAAPLPRSEASGRPVPGPTRPGG
jgi:hypothetical protein